MNHTLGVFLNKVYIVFLNSIAYQCHPTYTFTYMGAALLVSRVAFGFVNETEIGSVYKCSLLIKHV